MGDRFVQLCHFSSWLVLTTGSEKDEDGFYFKGDTSVPSYHKSEGLQEPSESWDSVEEQSLQWSEYGNHVDSGVHHYNERLSQSPSAVADILSLTPEERQRFKQKMRKEAALRGVNSGRKLTSEGLSTCQGYNWSTDIREIQVSTSTNRAFHNCVDQDSAPSSSTQESQNLTQRNVSSQAASKSRNPIFQYCVGQMQNILENSKTQGFVSNNEQNVVQDETIGNLLLPQGQNGQISTYHVTERSPNSSTYTNAEFRGGFIEIEMAKLALPGKRSYPEVTAVPGVCGQPTSPTSTGVKGPLLAGVGRARLLAEARKNNFGGICNSPPKVTGTEEERTPPSAGRGRGMLNYFT